MEFITNNIHIVIGVVLITVALVGMKKTKKKKS
ncbi:hypothetical protein IKC_04112 [Bacillus cereus VD184]|uniref:Uncharacterized protein n=2 Tax=Bacillus cereus TaxID=1396 RepID=A0A9W5VV05_BACCE|nr:putative membrane protein [Bacillus cereus 03BB108]EOQ19638.1 hypothetical protein IKC_04112 [Bacillus cereus VD184]